MRAAAYVWVMGIGGDAVEHGGMPVSHARSEAVPPTSGRRALRKSAEPAVCVSDDWPDDLPIEDDELRAVEAWFGAILDDLWGAIP